MIVLFLSHEATEGFAGLGGYSGDADHTPLPRKAAAQVTTRAGQASYSGVSMSERIRLIPKRGVGREVHGVETRKAERVARDEAAEPDC